VALKADLWLRLVPALLLPLLSVDSLPLGLQMGFVGEDARLFAIAAAVHNFLGPARERAGGAWRISDREEPAFCLALNRANVASGAVKVVAISVGGVDALRVAHPLPIPSPDEDAARIDQQIKQVCFAEKLGFSDVWLTEHYFTGESVYNDALLFASAVAMRTERIRIGFAVVQLPFHHPVRLAVQLALLDNLSRGRIDVGVGKGTIYNEYEFVGHGLRSDDSRERMEEAIEILERLWNGGSVTYSGKYFQVHVPELRPRPVQRPRLPLWRSVISPASFNECGRLGLPILTARLPVTRIRERWAAYEAGLDAGGHDATTRAWLLAQNALWRNVYVAGSDSQAEDELAALLLQTRAHMMRVRAAYNPPDFTIDPAMLNPWADPAASDAEAIKYVLATGSLFGSPAPVLQQVAELRDVGVRHLLCQTGFGDMSHEQNLASMWRFGEEVMPAFRR
jgi:alkanesulfonate monooxygenase SsuD/methylene tetrahydromethanopterin reductase-like flavin-dependent oxidoreductase (luciferase family)